MLLAGGTAALAEDAAIADAVAVDVVAAVDLEDLPMANVGEAAFEVSCPFLSPVRSLIAIFNRSHL